MTDDDTPRLACGRPVDAIWQHIDQPPDEHARECPHCQAARDRLAELRTATTDFRQADQSLVPNESTKTTIMEAARAEVRRSRRLPLTQRRNNDDGPDLRISEQAVATMVRRAADRVDGVRSRRCRIDVVAADAQPDEPVAIQVELRIATVMEEPIPALQRRVRRSIINAVRGEVGIDARRVDLVVEDIIDA